MNEQDTIDLADVQSILLSARVDATCDQWHLEQRAVPPLKAVADRTGEARLHKAMEHTAKAGELFDAARDALAMALSYVDPNPQRTER